MEPVEIELYVTEAGKRPFDKWAKSLASQARAIIRRRLTRLELGNFGDAKSIKGARGLYELRIHEGPGYRVYFGKRRDVLVILLSGGKKGTQSLDISKAKKYWQDYLENNEE